MLWTRIQAKEAYKEAGFMEDILPLCVPLGKT